LKAQIQELTRSKIAAAVPVFSVAVCTNPLESPNDQSRQAETAAASSPIKNETLSFGTFEIKTAKEYGDFNLKTGIFTVKKSGIFKFNLTGLAKIKDGCRLHCFHLSVDRKSKSKSLLSLASSDGHQPIVISVLLPLVTGQKVSIIRVKGGLYDTPHAPITRFSCVFRLCLMS